MQEAYEALEQLLVRFQCTHPGFEYILTLDGRGTSVGITAYFSGSAVATHDYEVGGLSYATNAPNEEVMTAWGVEIGALVDRFELTGPRATHHAGKIGYRFWPDPDKNCR